MRREAGEPYTTVMATVRSCPGLFVRCIVPSEGEGSWDVLWTSLVPRFRSYICFVVFLPLFCVLFLLLLFNT